MPAARRLELIGSKVSVLRLGHRKGRDDRITSHVALVARAFGAKEVVIADTSEKSVERTIEKVTANWGGRFKAKTGIPWRSFIAGWKKKGGEVIHLTMYGQKLDTILPEINLSSKDKLIVVGASKVPGEVYKLADYNVSITNQPHSEIAALAVFLDRFFKGMELSLHFRKRTRIH